MAGKFNNLAHFFPTYASMLGDFRRQRVFLRRVILPLVEEAARKNDGSLDEDDFQKMLNYYGFGVPAIVGEGFCTLRGKSMNQGERMASTCQGVITGLYDDFFDKTKMDTGRIKDMMHRPFDFNPASSLENLFIQFLRLTHQHAPDTGALNKAFDRVFDIQLRSKKQTSTGMDHAALLRLTMDKGACSLLFYRTVFIHQLINGEREAIYEVGGLMQFANDLFDVYEDSREGINTLVTRANHIRDLRAVYQNQLDKAFSAIKSIPYPGHSKKLYMRKLSLGISRCMVCLDQLEDLEKRNGDVFSAADFSRKELICDMEKPGNLLRSLYHHLGTPF